MATLPGSVVSTPAIISEKTVELNLTLEIVNYMGWRHNRSFVAWGPTQRQEANWGFDCAIGTAGRFMYIQFKRAHDDAPGHRYELNRTKAQDQHAKLVLLESMGLMVRYGLPRFTTMNDIVAYRKRLLVSGRTAWIRPSAINMPNGGVGHHDLFIHPHRWWLQSDPVEVPSEDEPPFSDAQLEHWTKVAADEWSRWGHVFSKVFEDDPDATQGGAIIFLPA